MADQGSIGGLLKSLRPVKRGDHVSQVASSERINAMQNLLRALARGDNIRSGENVRLKRGEGFVMVSANPKGRAGGGADEVHFPWETSFSNEGTEEDPNYRVRVRPGSVNSLIPSDIFDIDDSAIDAGGAGLYYVKIRCDTDGKTPNAISMVVDQTPVDSTLLVAENVAPPTFYDTIALIVVTVDGSGNLSGEVYQVRRSNIAATPIIMFLVPQTPASPGDEPFIRWWGWNLAFSA